MVFNFSEGGDELGMQVEYSTDIYDGAFIERMIGHYRNLLREVTRRPEQAIDHIDFLSGAERRELLEAFNDTEASYPSDKTIVGLFGEQAERTPDRVAVVDEGEEVSYRELDERSNQLGHYLRERGVREETLVPICMDRSVELIVGILGILKAGGAYVPIDPGYPEERVRYMVEDAGGGVVVTTEGYRGLFGEGERWCCWMGRRSGSVACRRGG